MNKLGLFLAHTAACGLVACGGGGSGGGGSSALPKFAQGVYSGTITGGTYPQFQLLVLENEEQWSMYGTTSGSAFLVGGFVQGQGASSNGAMSVGNAMDFGFSPAKPSPMTGNYTASNSFLGTVTYAGPVTVALAGTPIVNPLYNYNTPASITDVQGPWSLTDLAGIPASVTIQMDGTFSGTSGGCSFSGTLVPRASGKNVFDMSLTFGAAPCARPGQTATGIALSYLASGSVRQLIVAGTDVARTTGTALFGTR